MSRSSSSGYQTPLPLRSTSTSPEFGSSGQAEQETVVFSSLPFSRCVLLDASVSSLLLCSSIGIRPDLSDQREQGFFKPRGRPSPLSSLSRCATRGYMASKQIQYFRDAV